eukprot:CAMPEP_0172556072 /NCGR_PEP_ID=MMETSP1067-20121228/63106_1 /TAXON_ID=265564 ORGANISM="Thalassiosira punctigera, Strain Tpunct2005C2" /NCGR_SAMPLE_ID=MMETSP1067 /ASSEMBLY_ACC=CAM_ASM_000444 /LENGTH=694 /DNA_ID=CAMNT_0013344759 /DNA_START=1 /DNA_END=2085 /DNA_ORIENTATION=+
MTKKETPSSYLSRLYLKCMGYIFSVAFISYYAQYPALSSRSGVEPSERAFKYTFPKLFDHVVEGGYSDPDSFAELLTVFGLVLSVFIASGIAHHGLLFLAVTSIYHFLVILGTSFYTFQWDILLIETGFLTGVCFAPWRSLRLNENEQQAVGSWPVRFLLFKLMFMSGVVKVQAECPTWQNLTALEFHFATQCLPGPLAWYAHQLPPLLLRLGVAATFVIEIPAAFLLLTPTVTTRKVGAWMQILLQLLIILTGSYNYFNLLTMALCLPCMVSEESHVGHEKARSRISHVWNVLQLATCAFFLAWTCKQMFSIERFGPTTDPGRQMIGLKLSMTKHECNLLVEHVIPASIVCTLAFTAVTGVRSIIKKKSNRLGSFVHALVCCVCIVVTAIPFFDLSPNLYRSTFLGVNLKPSTWRNIRQHSSNVSHGYGLFRRMTGVGKQSTADPATERMRMGWAGLPPSIVARPEIIFEALIDDSAEWRELRFRWKPGRVDQLPLQAAPHQPRFDWRMWFAALGTIQHNPWLVSFTDKILNGCSIVLDLLDEPEIVAGRHNITRVRANLYHYDFTRLDTEWARRIPGVKMVDTTSPFRYPGQVWTRKLFQQYLPPLEVSNQSLRQFLHQSGYGTSICAVNEDRCKDAGPSAQVLCRIAVSLRNSNEKSWALPLAAFFSCVMVELWGFSRRRKRFTEVKLKSE